MVIANMIFVVRTAWYMLEDTMEPRAGPAQQRRCCERLGVPLGRGTRLHTHKNSQATAQTCQLEEIVSIYDKLTEWQKLEHTFD